MSQLNLCQVFTKAAFSSFLLFFFLTLEITIKSFPFFFSHFTLKPANFKIKSYLQINKACVSKLKRETIHTYTVKVKNYL